MPAKYDDVTWHTGEGFPVDLDVSSARTHIGLFLAWIVSRHLESNHLHSLCPDDLHALREGELTGADFLARCCDDKLTDNDLSHLGNSFAGDYYEQNYLDDYVDLSDDRNPTIYHEPDTLEKFIQVGEMLDRRYQEWKAKNGCG